MLKRIFFIITYIVSFNFQFAVAGEIPASAKYYFTTSTVDSSNIGECATVMLSDWDGTFRRVGSGAQFLVGLITYQNRGCIGGSTTVTGSFNTNVYFQEPIFEQISDPIQCAPFLTCVIETGKKIVSQDSNTLPFTLQLTQNTSGSADGDRDGLSFPSANNKTLWVREGETASFFFTASYASPITALNLIATTADGWVTNGTSPFDERVYPTAADLEVLSLAGITLVPEPEISQMLLIGVTIFLGIGYFGKRYK